MAEKKKSSDLVWDEIRLIVWLIAAVQMIVFRLRYPSRKREDIYNR